MDHTCTLECGPCIYLDDRGEYVLVERAIVDGETAAVRGWTTGAERIDVPVPSQALAEAPSCPPRGSALDTVLACPLCGSSSPGSEMAFCVQQLFWSVSVRRCSDCGTLFKNEIPSETILARIYGADYSHFQPPATGNSISGEWRGRLARLGGSPGRLLDIGCGRGDFVRLAVENGWDAHGWDPYLPATIPSDSLGGRLHGGTLEELSSMGGFDVVTLWAVVEHLRNPLVVLDSARTLLAKGGRLVFNAPNGASLIARRAGPSWGIAQLVEHLSFLTPTSISWLANRLSLPRKTIRYCGSPYPFGRSPLSAASQGLRPGSLAAARVRQPADIVGIAEPIRGSVVSACGQRMARNRWSGGLLRRLLHLLRTGDHIEVILGA